MRGSKLDEIDYKLLALLQEDGRTSQHDLAEAVGLSSPSTGERLKKLVDRGVIRGFTAVLDHKALGQDVTAFITVGIDGAQHYESFVQQTHEAPEVMECHAVTGEGSHVLKVRTATTSSLEQLLGRIRGWPGVAWTSTSVVLSIGKESTKTWVDPSLDGDDGEG